MDQPFKRYGTGSVVTLQPTTLTSDDKLEDSVQPSRIDLIMASLHALGLDPAVISSHQRHVKRFISKAVELVFPVIDTCQKSNGGILPCLPGAEPQLNSVVSFVPAAGASSRWLAPLAPLMEALRHRGRTGVEEALTLLVESGVADCPLPKSLGSLVRFWREKGHLPKDWRADDLLVDIDAPKAFYPAVIDGTTFLELKRAEDDAMKGLAGEVFVCPPGRVDDFKKRLKACGSTSSLPSTFFEQGMNLATVRFNSKGDVCLTPDMTVSSVPSGHGALLRLFPDVRHVFPDADSVWIRNIDNVVGTSPEVVAASRDFLGTHRVILNAVKEIRVALSHDNFEQAQRHASMLLTLWPLVRAPRDEAIDESNPLVKILARLFHAPLHGVASNEQIKALFARPVVTMGQVPNTARDIGGTCVFATVNGDWQKLCLEVPHASDADRQTFLADPQKATHFNPVFVAAEIPSDKALEGWHDHPFWLIAKKMWLGQEVWYQESILYEMLGSSKYTNVTFVEIPRILFNPHKGLPDARGRQMSHWLK